ncbi:hypothetical protein [Hyphomonas atlantica]|uniref:Uncharacterized protein n=1 Tax=Hyphomonas atlantica TaxID=1280948 RepID=A0A059DWW3_9PROT|nr:hypothetical protein [Hyphomonas atlantica]KCZ57884.1 hypothetical protein HY36_11955 [Hyphomonas atlantica]
MTKTISGADLVDAFFEDDGSALWFELGNKSGERVRIEITASQFNAMMEKFADLTYQVKEAQIESIDTHAMSALQSLSEDAQSAVGGEYVVVRFQVDRNGLAQGFAITPDRALSLSARIEEVARKARKASSESRH